MESTEISKSLKCIIGGDDGVGKGKIINKLILG
jgi:hypothetical protein